MKRIAVIFLCLSVLTGNSVGVCSCADSCQVDSPAPEEAAPSCCHAAEETTKGCCSHQEEESRSGCCGHCCDAIGCNCAAKSEGPSKEATPSEAGSQLKKNLECDSASGLSITSFANEPQSLLSDLRSCKGPAGEKSLYLSFHSFLC